MLVNLEEVSKTWMKPECMSCTENFDKITSNLLIYASPTFA